MLESIFYGRDEYKRYDLSSFRIVDVDALCHFYVSAQAERHQVDIAFYKVHFLLKVNGGLLRVVEHIAQQIAQLEDGILCFGCV